MYGSYILGDPAVYDGPPPPSPYTAPQGYSAAGNTADCATCPDLARCRGTSAFHWTPFANPSCEMALSAEERRRVAEVKKAGRPPAVRDQVLLALEARREPMTVAQLATEAGLKLQQVHHAIYMLRTAGMVTFCGTVARRGAPAAYTYQIARGE